MEFNRIIKLLRKERGITQKQAAEDLGVSQALLSHYERVSASAVWISWSAWQITIMYPAIICWAARRSATA